MPFGLTIPAFLGLSAATTGSSSLIMGYGYTSGAYLGYGSWNSTDPLKIHTKGHKSFNVNRISLGMPYGNYGYRRRYRRRYYGRRSRYGYRRRSYRQYRRYY